MSGHRVPRALLLVAAGAALTLSACDPPPGPPDAGDADSGPDAGGRIDAGPPRMCEPSCDVGQSCCPNPAGVGEDVCFSLRTDPQHCGGCQIDCIASNRGDGCAASQCTCGPELLGCLGNSASFCCPPRPGTDERYCANLERDATNCGGCNEICDRRQADRCDGGDCFCGDTGERCLGTVESTCCQEGADIACADLRTDRFHCGACNVFCISGETCVDGQCTRGDVCTDRCELPDICCNGGCCTRDRCFNGICGGIPDAGPIDAGPDAGPIDAGPETDAGPIDAGPDLDAGPEDAGPESDAGPEDAGPFDAG